MLKNSTANNGKEWTETDKKGKTHNRLKWQPAYQGQKGEGIQ